MRNWKKMREMAGQRQSAGPVEPNPWQEAPTLRQLASTAPAPSLTTGRADVYTDWANRMRERRVAGLPAMVEEEGKVDPSAYWSVDHLFEESTEIGEAPEPEPAPRIETPAGERPNPWRVRNLLAVLDLRDGATAQEIGSAYRRLAKLHHPDRFLEADPETQAFHASEMRRIIDAYRALREAV